MACSLPTGLTPPEIAFVCEMELVTVIPRQRLGGLNLLGGPTPPLSPPHRTPLPLWLALLLKRQKRASILPPPWLSPPSLQEILETEKSSPAFSPAPPLPATATTTATIFSPPFLPHHTSTSASSSYTLHLPYHYLELSTLLLAQAADDIPDSDTVTLLLREIREIRAAKMRAGVDILEGGRELGLNGVGGMEVCEGRGFVCGVIDGLRKIGASKETSRREREAEERESGLGPDGDEDDDDDDGMDI